MNDAWLGLQTKYYQSEGMLGAWLQDTKQPEVVGVTVPEGKFSSGDYIPITVEFSEPVKADSLTLQVQDYGSALDMMDGQVGEAYKSKYVTFHYVVGDRNNSSIVVTGVHRGKPGDRPGRQHI